MQALVVRLIVVREAGLLLVFLLLLHIRNRRSLLNMLIFALAFDSRLFMPKATFSLGFDTAPLRILCAVGNELFPAAAFYSTPT